MNLYKDLLFELIFRFDPLIELEGALQTKTPISSLYKQHGSLPNAMWTLSGLVSTFKCIESQETGFPLWVDTRYATVYTSLNAFSKKNSRISIECLLWSRVTGELSPISPNSSKFWIQLWHEMSLNVAQTYTVDKQHGDSMWFYRIT